MPKATSPSKGRKAKSSPYPRSPQKLPTENMGLSPTTPRNRLSDNDGPAILSPRIRRPSKRIPYVITQNQNIGTPSKRSAPKDVASNASRSVRQPRHCTKCEGRPLRKECQHTTTGRRYLERQQIQPIKKRLCRRCPGKPLLSECCHSLNGGTAKDARGTQGAADDQLDTTSHVMPPENNARFTTPRKDQSSQSGGSDLDEENSDGPDRDFDDPFNRDNLLLDLLDNPAPTANIEFPSLPSDSSTPETSSDPPSTPAPPDQEQLPRSSPLRPKGPSRKNIQKASHTNPIHGKISGAKQGNLPYNKFRTHRRPNPRQADDDIAARYRRLIKPLIQRCEDLAAETGCWIFLGAQHVTAHNGAINYVSPRLVREANAAAEQLGNLFNNTASQLLRARRSEAVTFERKLHEVSLEKTAMEEEIANIKAKMAGYERKYGPLE